MKEKLNRLVGHNVNVRFRKNEFTGTLVELDEGWYSVKTYGGTIEFKRDRVASVYKNEIRLEVPDGRSLRNGDYIVVYYGPTIISGEVMTNGKYIIVAGQWFSSRKLKRLYREVYIYVYEG